MIKLIADVEYYVQPCNILLVSKNKQGNSLIKLVGGEIAYSNESPEEFIKRLKIAD